MPFRGRHRVYAIFWTWSVGPFVCRSDIATASGGKAVGSTQGCTLQLYPRAVPLENNQGQIRRSNQGYMDVLRPNDWVFVYVDPYDGGPPDPLFSGFIDDVRFGWMYDEFGAAQRSINIGCTSWEKAIQKTTAISDAWVSRAINIATLYDIAVTTVDNQFIPTTTSLIANIAQAYLFAGGDTTTRAAAAAAAADTTDAVTDILGPMTEAELRADIQALGEIAGADYEFRVGNTADGSEAVSAIPGQFELPGTNIPLWQFMRLEFEDLRERTFSTPSGMMNMLGMPLSKFVDEWSNPMLNSLIYDTRRMSNDGLGHLRTGSRRLAVDAVGGYTEEAIRTVVNTATEVSSGVGRLFQDLAPYMILMRRPLFLDEIMDLEGPHVSDADMESFEVGFSDADHYNMAWFEVASLNTQQFRLSSGITGFDADRGRAKDMIRRHGLRIYNDQCNSWPDNTSSPDDPPRIATYDPELYRPWNERIQRAGLDAVETLNGHGSFRSYVRDLFLGGKLVVDIMPHQGTFAGGDQRAFVVDGIDWQYEAQTGTFTTNVELVRGYSTRSNQNPTPGDI